MNITLWLIAEQREGNYRVAATTCPMLSVCQGVCARVCVWLTVSPMNLRCFSDEDGEEWNAAHDMNHVFDSPLVDVLCELLAKNLFLPHVAMTYVRMH